MRCVIAAMCIPPPKLQPDRKLAMPAHTAQIVSLSEFRQARMATRARENTAGAFLPAVPFFFFLWVPVVVFPLAAQAPNIVQNGG